MSENEVKNENLQPEEIKQSVAEPETETVQPVEENSADEVSAEEAQPVAVQTSAPVVNINNIDTQSEAYFEAMKKLEAEKKAEKKKKKKKKLLIFAAVIVALILFVTVKNTISNSITFNEQYDRVSAAVAAEEYDAEEYETAIQTIGDNTTVSDKKKVKSYFKLGKEAVEVKNLNCYEDLFNKCVEKDEKYKEKVTKLISEAIESSEDYVEFFDYAAYYISLGGKLDEASVSKSKEYLSGSIAAGKFDDYEKMIKVCESIGVKSDDGINAKIYSVAMEAYNAKNYEEAYKWFGVYEGKEDIKSAKQEATYEYVIQVLFGASIDNGIDDEFEWAKELLSTDEMKNYKQSEGIRLYCNLADAALKSYRNSQNKNAQDKYIKSKLLFPDSYNFLGKSVTSDFYMKKSGDDEAKICYDCTIAYSAMNKYGYTVRDTYNVTNSQSFNLNGSDYLLAVKVFNNFSNENMLKYARTGEFTNTKVTFEY